MNFFNDDDFGLGSSPVLPKKNASLQKPADQMSRKSGKSIKKDGFDLLDDLLNQQDKKSKKNRDEGSVVGPYSSTQLDLFPTTDFRTTNKWSTPNININESPKFPKSRMNSIEDRGSDDGRSFKSGFTGRQNNYQLDQMLTLRPKVQDQTVKMDRSTRNMMRPPLAKNTSKQLPTKDLTSVLNDDVSIKFSGAIPDSSVNFPPVGDRTRNRQGRNNASESRSVSPQINFAISDAKSVAPQQKIIEKIVTVREEATELKRQFESQIREIKESYERQLKYTKDKWSESIEEISKIKHNLNRQFQAKLEEQKRRWQTVSDENIQRLKEKHEWQLKKKTESHEMQIQKIKSISRIEDKIARQQSSQHYNQEMLEIKEKEHQLALQRKKIEEIKLQLERRQKDLQFQEDNFHSYRKKEEDRIQNQRKALVQKESDLKKMELEQKRLYALEKQKLASEFASMESDLFQRKQALNLEKEEVRLTKELFQKQRRQFQQLNLKVISDYKSKLKEVETQKEKVNDIQIQLYKKIKVVELTGFQRKRESNSPVAHKPIVNQQNNRNRANTFTSGWTQVKTDQTKERYKEMQRTANRGLLETKVHLEKYVNRINKSLSKH